jgi:GNAT superfamily N-acetyltransferase
MIEHSPVDAPTQFVEAGDVCHASRGFGASVTVRPLRSTDRDDYLRALAQLSPRTIARRFGGARGPLTEAEISEFLDVGHDGREAVVATTAVDDHHIVAVARFAPLPADPAAAETAIVVADDWQGRGVGTALLAHLVELARNRGYRTMYATSAAGNDPVTALLRRHHFRAINVSGGEIEWSAWL